MTTLPLHFGGGSQTASTQRRECIPTMTRSFALARLQGHREAFLDPRLPQRCLAGDGSGCLIAVKVEVQRNHALAAEVDGAKGGYARPRLVEPQQGVVRTLAEVTVHGPRVTSVQSGEGRGDGEPGMPCRMAGRR